MSEPTHDEQTELVELLNKALLARVKELEKQVAEVKVAISIQDDLVSNLANERNKYRIELKLCKGEWLDELDTMDAIKHGLLPGGKL